MPSDQTRTAILAAAERLYAERGFSDVTLRDIVAEANVNLAAVNYHFGSKDELIAELFVTRSLSLNRERLRELRAAVERSRSGPRHPRKVGPTSARKTSAMSAHPMPASSAARKSRNRSRFSAKLRVTNNSAISSSLEPK